MVKIANRALKPRRIPSRSWRELIKKVWEVDPLLCPQCHHEMRIVSLINDAQIIERILRHVGSGGVDQSLGRKCGQFLPKPIPILVHRQPLPRYWLAMYGIKKR